MKRKRKQKCIPGLGAARSGALRKRVRDELLAAANEFTSAHRIGVLLVGRFNCDRDEWVNMPAMISVRARYNRARALAAECGV